MAGSTTQQFQVGVPAGAPAVIDTTSQQREVSEEFAIINPWDTPFLTLLGAIEGSPGMNWKHEWVEPDLWKKSVTISSTTAATTTEVTLTLSAADAYRVPLGGVYLNRTSGEYVIVSARASTTTLTVVRDYAGSTGATMATAHVLDLVGVARQEGDTTLFKGHPQKSFPFNYYQLFEQGLNITKPAKMLNEYGMNRYEWERLDLQKTLKFALEMSVLHGKRFAGTSTTEPAFMGGIYDYAVAGNDAYVASLASAALAQSHINTALRDRLDTVGQTDIATDVWVNGFLKDKLDSLYENRIRTTMSEKTGGAEINEIVTSIARLTIHLHPNMKRDQVLGIGTDKLDLIHWPGCNWWEGDLSVSGLTDQKEGMAGIFSLEDRSVQAQWKLTNVSTSS